MINFLLIVFAAIAIIVLIMIVGLIPSLGGGVSIAFPGLGLIVSGRLVLAFLIIVETILVAIVAVLMR